MPHNIPRIVAGLIPNPLLQSVVNQDPSRQVLIPSPNKGTIFHTSRFGHQIGVNAKNDGGNVKHKSVWMNVVLVLLALAAGPASLHADGIVAFVHTVDGEIVDDQDPTGTPIEPGTPVYADSRLLQRSEGLALVTLRMRQGARRISFFPFSFLQTEQPDPIPERLHEHYLAQIGGTSVRAISGFLPQDVRMTGAANLLAGTEDPTVLSNAGPTSIVIEFCAPESGEPAAVTERAGFVVPSLSRVEIASSPESFARVDPSESCDGYALTIDASQIAEEQAEVDIRLAREDGSHNEFRLQFMAFGVLRDTYLEQRMNASLTGEETDFERAMIRAALLQSFDELAFQAAILGEMIFEPAE